MECYSYRSTKVGYFVIEIDCSFEIFFIVLHFPEIFKRVSSHFKLYVSMRYDIYLI